jgi:hypothetical protein
MRGSIPPLPQYVFMAWFLVKHRDNFTVLFHILDYRVFQHIYREMLVYLYTGHDFFLPHPFLFTIHRHPTSLSYITIPDGKALLNKPMSFNCKRYMLSNDKVIFKMS